MLDVDSFNHIIEVVRTCVAAGRADLIEPSLIDRQHVADVRARIEADKAKPLRAAAAGSPAAPQPAAGTTSRRSLFGEPTAEQRDALAEATRKRFESYAKGSAG
jgi:hypothetical protein